MLSGGKQLGVCLVLAGLLGMGLLTAQPASTVQADIRLDDYETSWPNHVEVQDAGAGLIEQLNGGALPLRAAVRKDRSTVAVIAAAATPPGQVDQLIDQVVDQDGRNRVSTASDTGGRLAQLLNELDQVAASSSDPSDLAALSNESVTLRREMALDSVVAGSTRSRFVALTPASERTTTLPVLQWLMAAGLIGVGSGILLRTKR